MKLTAAYIVAICHQNSATGKPWQPIWGETYQCEVDGCPVYQEQISHHPPITQLLVTNIHLDKFPFKH